MKRFKTMCGKKVHGVRRGHWAWCGLYCFSTDLPMPDSKLVTCKHCIRRKDYPGKGKQADGE